MTDREMLELAAKACNMDVRWHDSGHYGPTMEIMETDAGGAPWNPLTDDGDALRLAVKLRLTVAHDPADEGEGHYAEYIDIENDMECSLVVHGDDPVAATRRAIVEAAAEIGKAMP